MSTPSRSTDCAFDSSLLPQAIEEMLRWVTPVMRFRRTATCDTKVGGQTIRKGEKLVMD